MNPILAFLKASRWLNLLIIAYTQIAIKYFVMDPFIRFHDLEPALSNLDMMMLIGSTLLIAAAGNIINDYFDLKIDRINKPDRIVVGRFIKRRHAMAAHIALTTIGLIIGTALSIKVGIWQLFFIHVFWIITLWYYSTELKYLFFWGNLAVAACIAMVPLSVGLFEIPTLLGNYTEQLQELDEIRYFFRQFTYHLFFWVLGFTAFAFLVTLAREITKDIIDIEGDKAFYCKTVPISLGIPKTKIFVSVIYALILFGVLFIQQVYVPDLYSTIYLGILAILVIATTMLTYRAQNKAEFKRASTFNKILTVLGISYSIIVLVQLS
jgi:4-hydroxybenzoate polyprenyltransferase